MFREGTAELEAKRFLPVIDKPLMFEDKVIVGAGEKVSLADVRSRLSAALGPKHQDLLSRLMRPHEDAVAKHAQTK